MRLLGIPADRIEVVYAGASELFQRVEDAQAAKRIRERFHIRDRFILCVGGFNYTKNLTRVIQSFSLLDRTLQDEYQLVVVCKLLPSEKVQLRETCEEFQLSADHVILTNYVPKPDLVTLYNAASLLLYPSLYDGFGLPVLEAMQCGLPVVTSNVSSLPEVAGEAGQLVDPYDPQTIAESVTKVLSDSKLQQEMRERGLVQAAKFSWERTGRATLEAYRKVMQSSRAPCQVYLRKPDERERRIAYFSPLNPQKSGISDYSEELLPHLARYFDIDLFVDGYQPSSDRIINDFRAYDYRVY